MLADKLGIATDLANRREAAMRGLSEAARHRRFPAIYPAPAVEAPEPQPEVKATPSAPPISVPQKTTNVGYDTVGRKRLQLRPSYGNAVVQVVCQVWGITHFRMMSEERTRRVAWPRMAAYMILRDRCGVSAAEIGRFFSRDHTTVMDGLKHALELRETDSEWLANYEHVNALLDEAAAGKPAP